MSRGCPAKVSTGLYTSRKGSLFLCFKGPCWRLPLLNHEHVLSNNQIKLMSFALLSTWSGFRQTQYFKLMYYIFRWFGCEWAMNFSYAENRTIFKRVFSNSKKHMSINNEFRITNLNIHWCVLIFKFVLNGVYRANSDKKLIIQFVLNVNLCYKRSTYL